uniref:Ethylmalonyl-CoA decarboxylase (inferred by orthology to a human protein) n=1 Tax=Anisakis simplex TaxID=6269 RepID=A0A0M3J5V6_ANISI
LVLTNASGRNAMTGRMFLDLERIVQELGAWPAGKLVIVSGANGQFCSGGDLRIMKRLCDPHSGYTMHRFMSDLLRKFRRLPQLSLAKVEGWAIGGGAELTCTCDLRAFHVNSRFGYVQSKVSGWSFSVLWFAGASGNGRGKERLRPLVGYFLTIRPRPFRQAPPTIGVTPGWGTALDFFRIVGRARATEMLAMGTVLKGAELAGKGRGLANLVYSSEAEFEEYVNKLLVNNVTLLRSIKKLALVHDLNDNNININNIYNNNNNINNNNNVENMDLEGKKSFLDREVFCEN